MNNFQFATPDKDFVITCTYDALPDLVWKAWTDPEELAQWFGPKIFTNRCQMDLKPGGAFEIVMVSPDRIDYPITGNYIEISPNKRLVIKINCDQHPQEWHELVNQTRGIKDAKLPEGTWTIDFVEQSGKTKMTITLRFDTERDRDAMLKLGMKDGWAESLEKLQELLPQMTSGVAPHWVKKWEQ